VIPVFPREPWVEVKDRVAKQVMDECAEYFDDLPELEIDRTVLGSPELEERFNSPHGNVYHVDPLLFRFGPLRPAMGFGSYKTPVPGLYLSGAGTHPTGGLCGLPGKLAAAEVLREGRGGGSPIRRLAAARRAAKAPAYGAGAGVGGRGASVPVTAQQPVGIS
jgi:phytoene dehydrogenase-like protein